MRVLQLTLRQWISSFISPLHILCLTLINLTDLPFIYILDGNTFAIHLHKKMRPFGSMGPRMGSDFVSKVTVPFPLCRLVGSVTIQNRWCNSKTFSVTLSSKLSVWNISLFFLKTKSSEENILGLCSSVPTLPRFRGLYPLGVLRLSAFSCLVFKVVHSWSRPPVFSFSVESSPLSPWLPDLLSSPRSETCIYNVFVMFLEGIWETNLYGWKVNVQS